MSTKRNATPKEMRIARDALTRKSETPRKTYFDNFVIISLCVFCLVALALMIQYKWESFAFGSMFHVKHFRQYFGVNILARFTWNILIKNFLKKSLTSWNFWRGGASAKVKYLTYGSWARKNVWGFKRLVSYRRGLSIFWRGGASAKVKYLTYGSSARKNA